MAVVVGRENRRAGARQALGVAQVDAQHKGEKGADDQQEKEGLQGTQNALALGEAKHVVRAIPLNDPANQILAN